MSTTTRTFISSFIDKYRNSPCLWQVTHDHYHDRFKKNAALKELLIFYKTQDKDANLETVKRMISSIRNCFKKELNKVKASIKSGDEMNEVHVPKLWYYNEMLFLADNDVPGHSESVYNQSLTLTDILDTDQCENITAENSGDPEAYSPSSSSVCSRKSSNNVRSKNRTDALLSKISKKLDSPPEKLKYAAYGEHVAEKLRSMPPLMATYCQKIMNDAIFMAETNNLDINSRILTD